MKFNDKKMNLTRIEKLILSIGSILFILSNFFTLCVPSILGMILDTIISNNNLKDLNKFMVILGLISLIIITLQYISSKILNKLNRNINIRMSEYIFSKVKRMNLVYWYKEPKGEIVTIISSDIFNIVDFITNSIPNLLSLMLSTILIFWYIIESSVWIAVIIFFINTVLMLIQYKMSKIVKNKSRDLRDLNTEVNSNVSAIIQNVENLLLKDYLESSSLNYNKSNRTLFIERNDLMDKVLQSSTVNLLASLFSIFIIVGLGGYLADMGSISAGNLVALILYSQKIFSPLTNITKILMKINTIIPMKNKIDYLLDEKNIIKDLPKEKCEIKNNLSFNSIVTCNLETGYEDKNIKIVDLNIDFTKGNVIGIIGNNGSGKTTVIKLLRKLLPIRRGDIRIDNILLNYISVEELMTNIQVMPQSDFLNQYDIKYIRSELQKYEKDEDVHTFLGDDLDMFQASKKYEYNINSKGELQKLSFLNTIFKKAKLYILDEPSSSMDLKSEKYMAKIIKNFAGEKKFIIITHRPELLKICNEIIDFSN